MFQCKKSVVAIFALVVFGAFGASWSASAIAGCAIIGGVRKCAAWITGSEVMLSTVTGLGNIKDTCPTGSLPGTEGCPLITATVFGTNGSGNSSLCRPADQTPGTVDPAPYAAPNGVVCSIQGVVYCLNPKNKSAKAEGQPFHLSAVLSEQELIEQGDCSKNGKCTETVVVGAVLGFNPCVNPNWNPISFVASEYYGHSRLNWIDNKGVPQQLDIVDYCTAVLPSTFKPGQMYQCTQLEPQL